jgi:hypothetical protein
MYLFPYQDFFYNKKWYIKKDNKTAHHKDGTDIPMAMHTEVQFDPPKTNEIRKHMFRFRKDSTLNQ